MTPTSIFTQTDISGTTRVDSATMSFTLAAYAHLPQSLTEATWRIVLPESALENWGILNNLSKQRHQLGLQIHQLLQSHHLLP